MNMNMDVDKDKDEETMVGPAMFEHVDFQL